MNIYVEKEIVKCKKRTLSIKFGFTDELIYLKNWFVKSLTRQDIINQCVHDFEIIA